MIIRPVGIMEFVPAKARAKVYSLQDKLKTSKYHKISIGHLNRCFFCSFDYGLTELAISTKISGVAWSETALLMFRTYCQPFFSNTKRLNPLAIFVL